MKISKLVVNKFLFFISQFFLMSFFCISVSNAGKENIEEALVSYQPSNSYRFTKWGFDIYDTKIWRQLNFDPGAYQNHPFAIELTYLRSLKGASIAEQSIKEIQNQIDLSTQQEKNWLNLILNIFPDVSKGDRITGFNIPNKGTEFWLNEHKIGEVLDPIFSKYFFGIWLSLETSDPDLRKKLIQQ